MKAVSDMSNNEMIELCDSINNVYETSAERICSHEQIIVEGTAMMCVDCGQLLNSWSI